MNSIGLYGLGVMGQSLVLNIASKGYKIAVCNRSKDVVKEFKDNRVKDLPISCYEDIKEFVDSLKKPRMILIMVQAGKAVDAVIEQFKPYLDEKDILVDCGNSYYKDTIRRVEECKKDGICFFGAGVSGGEMGALYGPSIMPSGDKEAYEHLKPILNAISAKAEDGAACCTYIGDSGSGHYVKMVHNGIEYGDIQIICEAYDIMSRVLKMPIDEIQKVFDKWNKGKLSSYLIDITSKILTVKDEKTNKYLVEVILDKAGQKGTGKWTSMEGLDLGVGIPTIAESVFARCLSAIKDKRLKAAALYDEEVIMHVDKDSLLKALENAVYCAKIISYAQGFALLKEASDSYNWDLNYGEIAMIWRNGCIIRAAFLQDIKKAYDEEDIVDNLIMTKHFSAILKENIAALRQVTIAAIGNGVYVPCLSSALEYYDGYRSPRLPANLLQAQRDFFGAHTYERLDEKGSFHTKWEEIEY